MSCKFSFWFCGRLWSGLHVIHITATCNQFKGSLSKINLSYVHLHVIPNEYGYLPGWKIMTGLNNPFTVSWNWNGNKANLDSGKTMYTLKVRANKETINLDFSLVKYLWFLWYQKALILKAFLVTVCSLLD